MPNQQNSNPLDPRLQDVPSYYQVQADSDDFTDGGSTDQGDPGQYQHTYSGNQHHNLFRTSSAPFDNFEAAVTNSEFVLMTDPSHPTSSYWQIDPDDSMEWEGRRTTLAERAYPSGNHEPEPPYPTRSSTARSSYGTPCGGVVEPTTVISQSYPRRGWPTGLPTGHDLQSFHATSVMLPTIDYAAAGNGGAPVELEYRCGENCIGGLVSAHLCSRKEPRNTLDIYCRESSCKCISHKRGGFNRHSKSCGRRKLHDCPFTNCKHVGTLGFTRNDNLLQHRRNFHGEDLPKTKFRLNGKVKNDGTGHGGGCRYAYGWKRQNYPGK